MDRNKRDLEAQVASQKEQLTRYEKRLKDVVTAYKGLLKEKEALDTSLASFTTNNDKTATSATNATDFAGKSAAAASSYIAAADPEDKNLLQTQIITLMNSLATLSAEKSRMEASFQADKKQLRGQLAHKDQRISELQLQIKENEERAKISIDEVKAKWIIERQEREQETNNQMIMIRELQKLYADERHLKENIEMQLNNFKTQFASDEAENNRLKELKAQLKEARVQLQQLQSNGRGNNAEDEVNHTAILRQVQEQMHQLKEQHAVAIKTEQKRVHLAEERSKNLAELHEDRVANLEARLAELSSTVGTYDRLRQQDQRNIQELKQKLQNIELSPAPEHVDPDNSAMLGLRNSAVDTQDVTNLVEQILCLKKILISENARTSSPIDLNQIFSLGTDHAQCQQELRGIQQQLETVTSAKQQMHENMVVQKSHINTLQEKVKVLNRNIDEQDLELKQQGERQHLAVKDERAKWKEAIAELENEYRSKVYDMEQQLQNQRQRSLQLLDEKEQEIKTLHTSFEVFHTATMPTTMPGTATEHYSASSDCESVEGAVTHKVKVMSKKMSVGENCHMLHYANEIARKDIEIAGLRKAKYAAESSLRKAIHSKVSVQEDLGDKIATLEEQVDRLERCKTREGANLEYLKNVIISFIVTKDADGKQHMLNAISAVLQFTTAEIHAINAAFPKK